jgi:hypothetical protein
VQEVGELPLAPRHPVGDPIEVEIRNLVPPDEPVQAARRLGPHLGQRDGRCLLPAPVRVDEIRSRLALEEGELVVEVGAGLVARLGPLDGDVPPVVRTRDVREGDALVVFRLATVRLDDPMRRGLGHAPPSAAARLIEPCSFSG